MSPAAVRWMVCIVALAAAVLGLDWRQYGPGTLLWIVCGGVLIAGWPSVASRAISRPVPRTIRAALGGTVIALIGWLLFREIHAALTIVFAGGPDANFGDMLVVIDLAVDRLLDGHAPYGLYYVPWEVPLPYGPMLWGPYVFPHLFHMDSRLLTLVGQVCVPAACGVTAAWCAWRHRTVEAIGLCLIGMLLAQSAEIQIFFAIGHTQVYWPLLLVFAICVADERWTACCVTLGLLVAARTTMVSLVPILWLWMHHRGTATRWRAMALAAAAVGPFVPFLLFDPQSVAYGLYGSYQKVMKQQVWQETNWALTTFGSTSMLLARGWERYVEWVQLLAMTLTYGAAWRGLRARQAPLPWMVLALLVFSMTTLWPVLYIYFDVWMLAASGLVATAWQTGAGTRVRPWAMPSALVAGGVVVVLLAAASHHGVRYAVDIGTPEANGFTGGGFGADVSHREGERTYVWVEGTTARIRLPRTGVTGAQVRIELKPVDLDGAVQTMIAELNGHGVGVVRLAPDWQEVTFEVDRENWVYGFNVLDLHFSSAVAAAADGAVGEAERSAAIARVAIE